MPSLTTLIARFRRFRVPRRICLTAVVLGAAAFLNRCYLPIYFDAAIEISRAGYFKMTFDGYLAKVELYDKIRNNQITPSEEKEDVDVDNVLTDFKRDTSTKVVENKQKGRFRVNWTREGDLTKVKTVTFYRRNENMLGISYNSETGQVSVNGRSIQRDIRQRLDQAGLDMRGEIRVITDTNVLRHNATKVARSNSVLGPNFKT
jgi:hypothetical protein